MLQFRLFHKPGMPVAAYRRWREADRRDKGAGVGFRHLLRGLGAVMLNDRDRDGGVQVDHLPALSAGKVDLAPIDVSTGDDTDPVHRSLRCFHSVHLFRGSFVSGLMPVRTIRSSWACLASLLSPDTSHSLSNFSPSRSNARCVSCASSAVRAVPRYRLGESPAFARPSLLRSSASRRVGFEIK